MERGDLLEDVVSVRERADYIFISQIIRFLQIYSPVFWGRGMEM